jgi:hypothetical protein
MDLPPRKKPMSDVRECVGAFIRAALVQRDAGRASGILDNAGAIPGSHPGLAGQSIYAAAILGDDIAVRGWLEKDARMAMKKGGPPGWDTLTYRTGRIGARPTPS